MKHKNKKKYGKLRRIFRRNRLFLKIYAYYGLILVFVAVLISAIYINLYKTSTTESYHKRQLNSAKDVAQQIQKYAFTEDVEGYQSYMKFLESYETDETKDIYVLADKERTKEHTIHEAYSNVNINDITLTKEGKKAVERAFLGHTDCRQEYDPVYEMDILYVAAPILDNSGYVTGVILMNCFVEKNQSTINAKIEMVIYSVLAALVVSFVVALVFARNLSKPISDMTKVALKMSHGDYGVRTDAMPKNELGILAKSLNALSEKLEKTEAERQNTEQMRRDFFANVSHELRTPITVVRGYAETLVDGVVKNEDKKQQYYERILNECKGMERLVGDLLILSKIQNPDFVIEKEPVNLMEIFHDLTKNLKVICRNKDIHIRLRNDQEYYMVLGDYDRLRQMFLVILDNAVKFSPEGSAVEIVLTELEQQVRIEILDHGVGISKEELPYIFEKFYKSKLRQNATGSGLGLVIAKHIAMKHDGTIMVDSEVGAGTKFTFLFQTIEEEEYEETEE